MTTNKALSALLAKWREWAKGGTRGMSDYQVYMECAAELEAALAASSQPAPPLSVDGWARETLRSQVALQFERSFMGDTVEAIVNMILEARKSAQRPALSAEQVREIIEEYIDPYRRTDVEAIWQEITNRLNALWGAAPPVEQGKNAAMVHYAETRNAALEEAAVAICPHCKHNAPGEPNLTEKQAGISLVHENPGKARGRYPCYASKIRALQSAPPERGAHKVSGATSAAKDGDAK
jgi:hypothetical protein